MRLASGSSEERPRIAPARDPAEFALAADLFREYAARLGVDLCFQGFNEELKQLATMYGPPAGCLLLAWLDGCPVGCVGLRSLPPGDCEMKRLYVTERARGCGLGRGLADRIIDEARRLGYERMMLDTLEHMTEARRLYASLGFRERAPYYFNPLPGVRYMELRLAGDLGSQLEPAGDRAHLESRHDP